MQRKSACRCRPDSGMTLIEVMVVVLIIGILASIGYPSYRQQVMRSQRTEGRAALLRAQQDLQRCFTQSNTFLGCPAVVLPFTTERGLYQITNGGVATTATTYTLRATPQGSQAEDTRCGWLAIDQADVRTAEVAANIDECW